MEKYLQGFDDGYNAAVADICAGLRTGRTAAGEAITGAVHAAEVIARGGFVGLVSREALTKKLGLEIREGALMACADDAERMEQKANERKERT